MKRLHIKRLHCSLKWNLPYLNRYGVGWYTLLHLEVKKGYQIDYLYKWLGVEFVFLPVRVWLEWRTEMKQEGKEND